MDKSSKKLLHFSQEYTLPPISPSGSSSTDSPNSENVSLSPLRELIEGIDNARSDCRFPRISTHGKRVPSSMYPGIFETRRFAVAGRKDVTAMGLLGGDWHPGPDFKPFDSARYEDNALE